VSPDERWTCRERDSHDGPHAAGEYRWVVGAYISNPDSDPDDMAAAGEPEPAVVE